MANVSLQIIFSFALLFDLVTAGLDIRTVFLEKRDASSIISQRHRRANTGDEETTLPANLERECLEEVCDYEEAREVFQDNYRTDIFWSIYIDGDQCAVQPCKNGALCSDSVGGYDCICKSGFTGTYCETDQTVCPADDKSKGCDQFCKPGYQSYECLCARGWKLQEKKKCVPAVVFPCGKLIGGNQWDSQLSTNIRSEYKGLSCGPSECPWQAMLRHDSKGFCSGVILQDNMILTTAQCARTHSDFQVAVGKTMTSYEADEQVLGVKQVHVHPLYTVSGIQNDLAVVELKQKMVFKKNVVPACLPERDFADSVLMSEKYMGAITGWKEDEGGAEFQGNLLLNHLSYEKLSTCSQRHSVQVTNKMSCSLPQANADCIFGSGSPVLTLYREVFFITALVSRPAGFNCNNGHILQKVSRSLPWLNSFMSP